MLSKEALLDVLQDMRQVDIPGADELLDQIMEEVRGMNPSEDFMMYIAERKAESDLLDQIFIRRIEMMENTMENDGGSFAGFAGADDEDEDDDDDEDDDEDDDDDDEDDDEDDEDDEDDDDDDDEDEDDDECGGLSVVLESSFRNRRRYTKKVVESVQESLKNIGMRVRPRSMGTGAYVFCFEHRYGGDDVDVHVLVEEDNCNIRIEFVFPYQIRRGRGPFIDYMMMEKDFPLRYGKIIRDHSDNEQKLECSFCFLGAFAQESFERYWMALHSTMRVYYEEMRTYAAKKLTKDSRKVIRNMIGELKSALPQKTGSTGDHANE